MQDRCFGPLRGSMKDATNPVIGNWLAWAMSASPSYVLGNSLIIEIVSQDDPIAWKAFHITSPLCGKSTKDSPTKGQWCKTVIFHCKPEQADEKVGLPVIWDTMILMWVHCDIIQHVGISIYDNFLAFKFRTCKYNVMSNDVSFKNAFTNGQFEHNFIYIYIYNISDIFIQAAQSSNVMHHT